MKQVIVSLLQAQCLRLVRKRIHMKKITFVLLIFWGATISACSPTESIVVPRTDIAYQKIIIKDSKDDMDADTKAVGFVNADGSGDISVVLKYRPSRPIFSNELNGLLFLLDPNPMEIDGAYGDIFFLNSEGNYDECRRNEATASGFIFPIDGTKTVLANTRDYIKIINLDNCKVEKTVVTYENDNFHFIGSASVSDTGRDILYDVRTRTIKFVGVIYIVNIKTGAVKEVLPEGQNPSLSPDEKTIAYMGKDGIYVAKANGAQQKLLIPISISDYSYRSSLLPAPLWSPDGNLLIYHKCMNQKCENLADFSLYKVDVESGVEEKIIDNGLFPVWIK
jgi:Tol biopolymer transport system component